MRRRSTTLGEWEPVPNSGYYLQCPHCAADVSELFLYAWEEENEVPLPDRTVKCEACGRVVGSREARSEEPFTLARFYMWVGDVGDDWEPEFKSTVESVLGPCDELQAWDT